jgi:multicomponent Na+:H+ antiporter subunit D
VSWLLVLPILIPLLSAALTFLFWGSLRVQRSLSMLGAFGLLGVSVLLLMTVSQGGILAVQVGDWPAPFGITLVADHLSAIMVVMAGIMAAAIAVYASGSIDERRERYSFHPLVHALLTGVCGAFLTGDLFNFYVWIEVLLISSFVLLALGGERAQLDGAVKYVTINLLASLLLLTAIALTYGMTGTLNMADLAVKLPGVANTGLVTAVAMLFIIALGLKSAVFPLFFWLPASYHTPPAVVSALFAGLLTKVGVYALLRLFTLIFTGDLAFTHTALLWIGGLTMVTGVLGAVAQNDFRRILSVHIVSQIGYMIMGLALFTPLALAGAVFYVVHNIIAKTNLFLISGVTERLAGSYELKKLGGLYRAYPFLSLLFLVSALGLAGLPPSSGFFAKLLLAQAGLEQGAYLIVATALGVGVLTLFSMTKIWSQAFWEPLPKGMRPLPQGYRGLTAMLAPIAVLAALVVAMGIGFAPVFELSMRAAEDMLNPAGYIEAVLGPAPATIPAAATPAITPALNEVGP